MRGFRRYLCVCFVVLSLLGAMLVSTTPAAASDFYFKTWAQSPYPQQYSTEVIWIQLCNDPQCYSPIVGAPVHTEWNFRTSLPSTDWYTGNDGKAAIIRDISDATIGYTVRVDIYVFDEGTQIDSAYFTPGGAYSYGAPTYNPPSSNPPPPAPVYNPPPVQQSSGPVSGSGGVCPAGYPVKANDNSGIYHVPGGEFYNATNARNCFATEAAAQAAGYRKSLR